jgi:2-oxoglutarate dehydrogenase E2 component (dihydrolipoamide succinyltransferase)
MIDIKVPAVGESISEVTLVKWLKQDGDYVDRDEVIAELESEKATFEVNAEKAGSLKTHGKEGDTLKIGDVLASIDESAVKPASKGKESATNGSPVKNAEPAIKSDPDKVVESQKTEKKSAGNEPKATPVAAAIITDKKLDTGNIKPSGANGKIVKHDVLDALNSPGRLPGKALFGREVRREKMSNLRKTVSRRLVEAKNTTAMLTTFNEVDMSQVMALRSKYKEKFKEKHGVNLGFMSFFTKACCFALQEWPAVNAYIDGEEIIYHDYCDISIAVSAPKGIGCSRHP